MAGAPPVQHHRQKYLVWFLKVGGGADANDKQPQINEATEKQNTLEDK